MDMPPKPRDDGSREAKYQRQLWEAVNANRTLAGSGTRTNRTNNGTIVSVEPVPPLPAVQTESLPIWLP